MKRFALLCACVGVLVCCSQKVQAQSFGIELHNTVSPVAGAMGGVSIADPREPISALNGNPATLANFRGTQFQAGGAWVEPTYNLQHDGGIFPNIGAYSGKSQTQGTALGGFAVTQDLNFLGLPVTVATGLVANAGAGVNMRHIPASNGTSSQIAVLESITAAGVDLTDQLSVGVSLMLGTAYYDGPFVGVSAMVPDYALRGTIGADYKLNDATKLGVYFQTKQHFNFDDAISLEGPMGFAPSVDVNMDLPRNIGFGIANESLMDGNLLLAMDILWKEWAEADMFSSAYDNQWVFQFGTQYKSGNRSLRLGYVYAQNPLRSLVPGNAGGVFPAQGVNAIQYLQGQLAVINEHRISGGVGMQDVLPGVDMDLFAGGMFEDFQRFGATAASLESYWVGFGITWRFDRGSCACPTNTCE